MTKINMENDKFYDNDDHEYTVVTDSNGELVVTYIATGHFLKFPAEYKDQIDRNFLSEQFAAHKEFLTNTDQTGTAVADASETVEEPVNTEVPAE